jgi:c-di-GMP-binding flagellar brake protein YcgR
MNMEVNTTDGAKWNVLIEEKREGAKLQRRRYVRLDITSPVDIKLLVPSSEENSEPGLIPYRGDILNVSGGGLLIESSEALPEDEYVVMELELNGTDRLTGIVGKIKRCESESDAAHLIGVEFCTAEDIKQNCPAEYRTLLGDSCESFSEKVRTLLNKYVFNQKVQERSEKDRR